MFGYIKPLREQLRIAEDGYYRAVYCGVCRALGKRLGQAARMSLSYDATAMALFFASCADVPLTPVRIRCAVHPLKPRYAAQGEAVDMAADIGLLLAYHKAQDDWQDERKVVSRVAAGAWKAAAQKAGQNVPWAKDIIVEGLSALDRLEKRGESLPDAAAEPFAQMLAGLFEKSPLATGPKQAWQWLGYNTGRWLYLVDALDDMQQDEKKGCYNPILLHWPGGADKARSACNETMDFALTHTLAQAASALDFIPIKRDRAILENILYQGMPSVTRRVLCGQRPNREQQAPWQQPAEPLRKEEEHEHESI